MTILKCIFNKNKNGLHGKQSTWGMCIMLRLFLIIITSIFALNSYGVTASDQVLVSNGKRDSTTPVTTDDAEGTVSSILALPGTYTSEQLQDTF